MLLAVSPVAACGNTCSLIRTYGAHDCLKEAANIATCRYTQHSQQHMAITEAEKKQRLGDCRCLSDLMWAMSLMR